MMIPNGVKKLSGILRRITSKHHDDFYCRYFFSTENKHKYDENVFENIDF